MIDLWSQIDHVVPFVCFLVPITRMRSSNLSRIETNLPYCLIAGVQCDDVQNHTGLSSLGIFNIAVVKKVSPQRIRREEFKFIDKYRTASLGLNRYKS